MTKVDVVQIRVEDQAVGIMGLNEALEDIAAEYAESTDDEAAAALLNRLSRKNYIPDKAREPYKKAFLREFKKFTGKPYDEEMPSGLDIKVFGPGCVQCDRLVQELMAAVETRHALSPQVDRINVNIEHVRDIKEIARSGIMGTPALMINGKIKSVGKVPPRSKLIQWLEEAYTKQH